MKNNKMYIISIIAIIGIILSIINIMSNHNKEINALDLEKAEKVLKKIEMPINSKYYGYYYDNKKVTAKDLDDKKIIMLGINNILNESEEYVDNISKESLKKSVDSIFMNTKYKDQSINVGNCFGQIAKYSNNNYNISGACHEGIREQYITKIVKIKETKKKLIIKEKVIFVVYSSKDKNNIIQTIYKNKDKKKKIAKIKSDDSLILTKSNKYLKKGYTYKYVFLKKNNNYYFDYVQKD